MVNASLIQWRNRSFVVAAAASAVGLGGLFVDRAQFFQSYLFGFAFWFGMGISGLGLLMLRHVVGGAWGRRVQPLLEEAAGTLPVLALLFLPVAAGMSVLYPWARPAEVAADEILRHKSVYMNPGLFLLRAAFFFGLWIFASSRLVRPGNPDDPETLRRANRWSAPGLFFFVLTLSFAHIDWFMSVEPHWQSSLYGALVMVGQVLGALALLVVALGRCAGEPKTEGEFKILHDLGNLLLAFVMIWAYLSFSQYLIIWSANIPEEVTWYLHRQTGGWFGLSIFLAVGGFALPFLILLVRANKRRAGRLAAVAGFILALRVVDVFWLLAPSFHGHGFHVHWLDAVVFLAVGGVWMGAWLGRLARRETVLGAVTEVHS